MSSRNELAGLERAWGALDRRAVHLAGLALCLAGTAGTLWAQLGMGDSWRIGVDHRERTALVTGGPFRLVRNPIFSCMTIGLGGIALLTPNAIAAVTLLLLLVTVELQVRLVEEPYLIRTHGAPYRAYAARVGRFVRGIGRLAPSGGADVPRSIDRGPIEDLSRGRNPPREAAPSPSAW